MAAPVAAFSGTPLTGEAPIAVQFTDASTGTPTGRAWDFGDGEISTERNPEHTYTTAGTFTVTLTVTNTDGTDTEEKIDYLEIEDVLPLVSFEGDILTGDVPTMVSFTNTTVSGSACTWLRDFGDGATSTAENPVHTYILAGTYDVSLKATNLTGEATEDKTGYVSFTNTGHSTLREDLVDAEAEVVIAENDLQSAITDKAVSMPNYDAIIDAAALTLKEKQTIVDEIKEKLAGDTPVKGPDGSMHGDWHTETEEDALRTKGGIL